MGGSEAGQPEVLYSSMDEEEQFWQSQAPTSEAEVETTDGTTPVPAQVAYTNGIDGSGGSLQGVASDWWEVSCKVHSSTGEDTHDASSDYRYSKRPDIWIFV